MRFNPSKVKIINLHDTLNNIWIEFKEKEQQQCDSLSDLE